MKWITTNLPGLEGEKIIESKPQMIYEGCNKPGQVPFVIKIARAVNRFLKWL